MKKINLLAGVLLGIMAILMLGSVWNDSATMDELAHIPAAFGYATQGDYRLNPEHPPLQKAISGLVSWAATRAHFPTDTPAWRDDINGQWTQGATLLYESGNDADAIIFWARIPIMLLALLFGWILFAWTKNRFGASAGILTLFFYTFSPTILAHSRYVTTDLGATFGFFIGMAGLLAFLESPTLKKTIMAGVLFAIALLLKFSLVVLVPIAGFLLVAWVLTQPGHSLTGRLRLFGALSLRACFASALALAIVWIIYTPLVWNYPQERQLRDANVMLSSYGFRPAVNLNLTLINNRYTRPIGQYVLGVLMVQQRAAGGNTAFFLGKVSNLGSRFYFPLLYLLKESLAFHILTLLALFLGYRRLREPTTMPITSRIRLYLQNHFTEFSFFFFIAFYWLISLKSPLNIGVRHVMPALPFISILVAREVTRWIRNHPYPDPQNWIQWFVNIYQIHIATLPKIFLLALLLLWLSVGTIFIFPHYLAYYNELALGTASGWRYAVDSNYDWGQDLKRLRDFADENGIQKIAIDYFGGGSPEYYFGNRYESWWSAKGPAHGWFAISATFRQGAFGALAPELNRTPEDSYEWLQSFEPVARAGQSIFIYQLP